MKYNLNKKLVIIVAFLLLGCFLIPRDLYTLSHIKKFIIFIKFPWEGYERHELNKMEDMFIMKYSTAKSKHKVYLLQPGKYLRRKSNKLLYYIYSATKIAGKKEMIIKLVPFYGKDPRKRH